MDFDFVTYMRDCATRLKSIGNTEANEHFFRCSGIANMEELLGSASAQSPLLMVTDNPEGRLEDNDSDHVLDRQLFTFTVLTHVNSSDFGEREDAIKLTKAIAFKILGKMKRDKRKEGMRQISIGLRDLELGSITYNTIGPLGDNYYGTDVSFTILNKPDLAYDANDWTEDE